MRPKLKYVVMTGGPQVLTMIDASIEVFKFTSDIHELLDTLGHVYRVWMNAALALGLFGDYVPYMFSQQTKVAATGASPHYKVRPTVQKMSSIPSATMQQPPLSVPPVSWSMPAPVTSFEQLGSPSLTRQLPLVASVPQSSSAAFVPPHMQSNLQIPVYSEQAGGETAEL